MRKAPHYRGEAQSQHWFFSFQSPSRGLASKRSGPCCAPSSRRRGLRINSLPRRRESSLTPSRLLSHAEPLRWVRHGVPLSPSPAHRLSSNSVMSSGMPFTLSMNRSIFLRSCCPAPFVRVWSGECAGHAGLFHISLLYHYFLL